MTKLVPNPLRKPRRLLLAAAIALPAVGVPVALVAQDVQSMSNEEQKSWLTNLVQDQLSTPERQISISNIDGALGSNVSIRQITIADQEGVWLRINDVALDWNQAALFTGRLEVRSLKAGSIEYIRNAVPAEGAVDLPPPEATGFEVPEFPVAIEIGELAVPSVSFGASVFGLGSEISLAGAMTLEGGNLDAKLDIERLDGPGGTLNLDVGYQNESQVLDLALDLNEPENGVLANLLNIEGRPAVELSLKGTGPVANLDTELHLRADGREALGGSATIRQQPEGYAVSTELAGPLSTLIAGPYRPFFGEETRLGAKALVRDDGGLDISQFTLSGGQLSVSGMARTTSDNFLSRLKLDATIADPASTAVTLPVPGGATKVDGARVAIDFGANDSGDWSATVDVNGLSTPQFAADRFALSVGGVAENINDPATRRVTFNGDGTLSGIVADPAIEAALGDSVGLGIAGLWNAGEAIQLAQFRIAGAALALDAKGQIDGTDFDGDISVETSDIAPFSLLAGRQLGGGLTLTASGQVMPLSGGFDLIFDGEGRDLTVDDAVADRLLEGTVSLSGRLARTEAGISADDFRVANAQVQLNADGTIASEASDFTVALDLADLALISDQASGKLSVRGSARSTGADQPLMLVLDGTVPSGRLAGRTLRDGKLAVAASVLDGKTAGDVTGSAMLDGYQAQLATNFSADETQQALSDLEFDIAGARLTGAITRAVETGLLDGRIDVAAPDVSLAAALLLSEASGSVNAAVVLTPENGKQTAAVTANAADLRINGIAVGRADIAATVSDLFAVPVVNGTATAQQVVAGGVTINTLEAKASQSGDTTQFDAQAALATGTDVDIAGALSPIETGYSLALDRAALTQGTLSARLATPTRLVVSGHAVSLDAVRFNVGSGSITASGNAGDQLDVVVDISDLPLSIANAVMPSLGLAGTVNGRATISGSAADPLVNFEARASGVNAASISSYGIAPLNLSASGSYRSQVVTLDAVSANGAGGLSVSGSGRVPLAGPGVSLALTGSAPLSLANRFVADRGGQFSGTITIDARVQGSLTSPQFGGSVSTSGAGYVDPELNLRLTNITGRASLAGDRATIEQLTANLATGGSVSASGSIGITGAMPADVSVRLNSARYADGDLFVATVSGGLRLTGNLTGTPLLSGDVFVEQANITVPESLGGGAQLIDVRHKRTPRDVAQTLARAKVDAGGAPVPQTRSPGLLLDVQLNAPNQIFIRGRGLDAEVGGSVRLTGPLNNIQPVGAFSLNRGRLSILGQRLDFESGTVTLVGDLDPQLNFVARTQTDDITVFITVTGRVSEPDITFSSNPTLPQDEVLSRLIFKRGMGELSPIQLAQLAAAAAELVGGGGNGGLVDSLRGAAGLADLDVVTDAQGNVGVKAGTYIQDNVYLGVTAGANGNSKVTINLDVTDDLVVKGAAGQDGNSSVGVFYERDY
ncbi:translocation/assembly module TamB domain-containing protein [Devosia sp. PTR5]|uniref:Translocation/assembly module TamB domain-containing protein n=1 Tax=Devosia oryzisoli TaxID=2774138 RepID=A0A927FUV1_9HYPH|nr:translocation/assembly module TamB domain-containing protein [Devosia oryzisoli]MBD8066730.1 translocation/assembly module TamB domain-containing protein [Devosia oryzisoli]